MRVERAELTICRAWIPHELLEALDEFFEETVNVTPIGEPLFPPITAQQVNAALQTVESGVEVTTYTFRRAYIGRMAAHCM